MPKSFFESSIGMLKNKWLPFVLGIPLFFCMHHYQGIVVDAVLYLLQVIHSVSPDRFVNDPPFMFGNQDSFGFFTPLYKLFLDYFTIASGTKLACFLFQLLWIVSLISLVKGIGKSLKNRLWVLPITILFIGISADKMPHFEMLFVSFVQNYNCSRLLSIALGLGGLASLFSQKKWWSLILFAIGSVVHPLSAGWGLPIWFLVFFPKTKYLIMFFSAILPFTFLAHTGSLDILPDDWLKRPLLYRPDIWDMFRILIYVFFLWYFVPRKTSAAAAKTSKAIALILLIAFYWNMWGCLGKHILLYQLQTWRAEWLAWAVVTPFYFNILVMEIRKERNFFSFLKSRSCFVLCALALTLFPPINNPFFFVLAFVAESETSKRYFVNVIHKLGVTWVEKENIYVFILGVVLALWSVVSIVYADAVSLVLENTLPPFLLGGDFQVAESLVRSNMMACMLMAIFFAVYSACLKRYLPIFCFCSYLIFPFLSLAPLLGLLLLFFDLKLGKIKFVAFCFLLLCVVDGSLASQFRCQSFFDVFSNSFKPVMALWLYVLFVLFLFNITEKRMLQKLLGVVLVVSISSYAFCFWDGRSIEKRQTEETIELFKNKTIFESVQNRGKIFFYVTGSLVDMPRLQFLTGAYLSYNTHIGEIFYREQFFEARRRDNNLFYKQQRNKAHEKSEYRSFVMGSLSIRDTLIDRMTFLCSSEEITHLVSDFDDLPYAKQDSMRISVLDKEIYLYECPLNLKE